MRLFFIICMMCALAPAPAHAAVNDKSDAGKAFAAAPKSMPTVPARQVEPTAPSENVNAGPQLPTPRFVILGTDEVNVRTGPALKYPIKFIIRRDGLPVEIVREFDVWRQIRDMEGEGGWVHKSMLSGRRAVIVKDRLQTVLKKPEESARPVVKLEPGVVAALGACKGDWCSVKVQGYAGWIKRDGVWGVYPDEKFQE